MGNMGEMEMSNTESIKRVKELQDIDDAIEIIEKSKLAVDLCYDLLHPEIYGYSVTAEVRNRAREALGIEGRE